MVVRKKGIKEGRQKGREEGRKEGKKVERKGGRKKGKEKSKKKKNPPRSELSQNLAAIISPNWREINTRPKASVQPTYGRYTETCSTNQTGKLQSGIQGHL